MAKIGFGQDPIGGIVSGGDLIPGDARRSLCHMGINHVGYPTCTSPLDLSVHLIEQNQFRKGPIGNKRVRGHLEGKRGTR